jgi:hypothetical protein
VRNRCLLLLLLLGLGLTGCARDEEIVHYRVARVEAPPVTKKMAGKKEPVRFLGAILPDKDRIWFLKLVGPEAAVTPLQEKFEEFVKSIRFTGQAEPPVTWKLPEGWEQRPGMGFRYATIKIPSEPEPVELVVSPLGKEAASVKENVDRWRREIQLGPIDQADLAKVTRTIDVVGVNVTLVDMLGTRGQDGAPQSAIGQRLAALPEDEGTPKFTIQAPEGWTEQKPTIAFAAKQYEAGKGVSVTVSPLRGNGGGAALNINRWRGQIKLPRANDQELLALTNTLDLAAGKALYVDMENPKEPGAPRVLGVMLPRPDYTWFLKMTGPSDVVGREKANFEAFATSLRLEGK